MDTANFGTTLVTWLSAAGIKILIALVVLLVAFKIINTIAKKFDTANAKSGKLDPSTSKTLTYILKNAAKIIVVLCLVSYLGIDTTAMSALIASLGVAAGFALNGTLSNLAGGILLLITRPFKVGDFVDLCGYTGTVEEIQIVYTKIATIDNRSVPIPNGAASTSNIVNYSEKELRRVDLTFAVSQGTDYKKAMECINAVIKTEPLVIQEADNTVKVISNSGAGMEITCRAWCRNADYWTVLFSLNEKVKDAFSGSGITLPHQQVDVHMKNG